VPVPSGPEKINFGKLPCPSMVCPKDTTFRAELRDGKKTIEQLFESRPIVFAEQFNPGPLRFGFASFGAHSAF